MKYCKIIDGRVVATMQGNSISPAAGFVLIGGAVDVGWTQNQDGTWTPPGIPSQTGLKTLYSHRDFILRIGDKYAAIERLKDENNLLHPDQKNYDLSRLFQLWDKSDVIDLGDADLHAAFAAFVTLGIMSQADADAIMTPNEQA